MGAVSRSDISFAYPFMALAIVLVLVLSGVVFAEQVSWGRWLGVLIVSLGLIIAARS
jgi:drug/metabolite transporter (DMT)-like permease